MSSAHVVETVAFDIGFRSEADAWSRRERLEDFAAGRALAVIGEVFDEFAGAERVVRLDRLEIDLGLAPADEDEADAEDRLRDALRVALRRLIGAGGVALQDEAASVVAPATADLDRLWRLIHLGRMPWSSTRADQDLHVLVERVLANDGATLARALREAPDMPRLMERIARQWAPAHLIELARLLSGAPDRPLGPATLAALGPSSGRAPPPAQTTRPLPIGPDAGPDGAGSPLRDDGPAVAERSEPAVDHRRTWEQALVQAAAGPNDDPVALVRQAARRAFLVQLATGRVAPRTWDDMLLADPGFVVGALDADRLEASARAQLARTLTTSQWRGLLGLSMARADAEVVLVLIADAWPWRLDSDVTLEAISQSLTAALLDHAAALGVAGVRADLAATVSALVHARANLMGQRITETAEALAREWPSVGPAGAVRDGLVPILAELGSWDQAARAQSVSPHAPDAEGDGAPGEPTPAQTARPAADPAARWAFDALDDDAWEVRRRFEPARLAAALREQGRSAAWRDRFSADLDPIRLLQLIALWLPTPQARALLALAAGGQAWPREDGTAPSDPGAAPRRWLLDEILLATRGPLVLAEVVEGMIRRSARETGLDVTAVAQALADAWPADHSDTEAADLVRAVLAERGRQRPAPDTRPARLSPAPHEATADGLPAESAEYRDVVPPPPEPAPSPTQQRAAGEGPYAAAPGPGQPDTEPAAMGEAAVWDRLQSLEPAELARRLAAPGAAGEALRHAAVRHLRPDRLVQVLSLRLAIEDARLVTELAWPPGRGADDGEADLRLRHWIFEAALAPRPLDLTALVQAVAHRRAEQDGLGLAEAIGALGRGLSSSAASRLAALLASSAPAARAAGAGLDDPGAPAEAIVEALATGAFSRTWLDRLPGSIPTPLRTRLAAVLSPADTALARLAQLSAADRRDLLLRLRPHDAAPALETVERLSQAWRRAEAAPRWPPAPRRPEDIAWIFLLRELLEEDRLFEASGLANRWFETLTAGGSAEQVAAWRAGFAAVLAEATDGAALAAPLAEPARAVEPAQAWLSFADPEPEPGEAVYVANAGLVLAGPFIPMLFERLALVRDGAFVDAASAERAIHLVQHLVDGAGPAQEHELVLNKLICGMDLATPIGRNFEITPPEQETIESLLTTMIQRWRIIGSTSIAGLRESFLQRQGALHDEGDAWRLTVEPRAFDMLLDQIPWGFRTLKLAWMPQVLHVDWR